MLSEVHARQPFARWQRSDYVDVFYVSFGIIGGGISFAFTLKEFFEEGASVER